MRTLYMVGVGIHIFAAMTWIGGMAFMVFVLVPTLRKGEEAQARLRFLHDLALRFRTVGWIALGTLVATGAGNLWFHGVTVADFFSGHVFEMGQFGAALEWKLATVAVILAISATHDFWIGPRALRLVREAPESKERERYRRLASWAGRLNFVLAIVVLAFALQLVR
jgi:uncharacterized membrane protein